MAEGQRRILQQVANALDGAGLVQAWRRTRHWATLQEPHPLARIAGGASEHRAGVSAEVRITSLAALWDHRVGGRALFPATAVVELAAACARSLAPSAPGGTVVVEALALVVH